MTGNSHPVYDSHPWKLGKLQVLDNPRNSFIFGLSCIANVCIVKNEFVTSVVFSKTQTWNVSHPQAPVFGPVGLWWSLDIVPQGKVNDLWGLMENGNVEPHFIRLKHLKIVTAENYVKHRGLVQICKPQLVMRVLAHMMLSLHGRKMQASSRPRCPKSHLLPSLTVAK